MCEGAVTVLMATFNGEKYLDEQLGSLGEQSWPRIDLVFSDDGSSDGTFGKLETFCRGWEKGRAELVRGPRAGFAENFRALITSDRADGDYVAFCDQDDIWKAGKLQKAITWLETRSSSTPALFCGRTETFQSSGSKNAMSPLFERSPSFCNALVQSIAGANTMVMNRAAYEIVRESARRTPFVSHDWWTYLMVTGAGGIVRYSPDPDVLYRQHDANLVGANNTWRTRMSRLRFILGGRYKEWSDANLAALDICRDLLVPEAQNCMNEYRLARSGNPAVRLSHLRKSGVYRQSLFGQISLYLACIAGLM